MTSETSPEIAPEPNDQPIDAAVDGPDDGPAHEPDVIAADEADDARATGTADDAAAPLAPPDPLVVPTPTPMQAGARLEQAMFEAKRILVGQDHMVERLFVSWLARGHCLLEGAPGLAKTLAAETVATIIGGSFARIQFTPDLVPADLVGTRIYRPSQERFDIELGPIFANVVLADEINRAPAKVQSALLEVMAERHVSIGGRTHAVPDPFIVLATQNPIEHEGVYPLPEAQRDRFLMKVVVGYPSHREEAEIARRMGAHRPTARSVFRPEELRALQAAVDDVFVHDAVLDYAVRLVLATRQPAQHGLGDVDGLIAHGASPRATLGLVAAGRALALLRRRGYVLPQDIYDVARDVLRHRVLLSFDAIADGVDADQIVERVVTTVVAPRVTPGQDGPIVERAVSGEPLVAVS
jgi:MoxR-like ATPase